MHSRLMTSTDRTVSAPYMSGTLRAFFSWNALAVIVCAILLARWTWIFIAPKDAALPTTAAWKKTSKANHLFGDVPLTGAASSGSLGNIQLVGVFAHPTAGFAVLSIEGKQVGVGLGELVMPGTRLVETKTDHVLIERGGIRLRIDLPAGKPSSGIVNVSGPQNNLISTPEAVAQATQLSPEQRAAMQQELQHFRRKP
ncbi:MAG: hypothetical protein FD121_1219 [Gallionellaceae bacterium]|nr:MAG: hypothetical protein FD121_1219 [Gallionellaceae bacterium]